MRLSSSFLAPSAAAVLSTILLCGAAVSQTATGSSLPDITVAAPKPAARPHISNPVESRLASRRTSRTARAPSSSAQAPSSAGQTPSAAQGPVMVRIARLEARASSCNGGCETSFKSGKEPWVGCSEFDGRVCDCDVLHDVSRHTELHELRGLPGDQIVPGLGPTQGPVALQRPGRGPEVPGRRPQAIETSALIHTCRARSPDDPGNFACPMLPVSAQPSRRLAH